MGGEESVPKDRPENVQAPFYFIFFFCPPGGDHSNLRSRSYLRAALEVVESPVLDLADGGGVI